MIFGSKTGYGRVDLILQPLHLQVCNEIDSQSAFKFDPALEWALGPERSGCRFDRLPRVLILELRGGEIAER
jgi:hypothetical protein